MIYKSSPSCPLLRPSPSFWPNIYRPRESFATKKRPTSTAKILIRVPSLMAAKLPASRRSSIQQCRTFYFPFAHWAILKKAVLIKSNFINRDPSLRRVSWIWRCAGMGQVGCWGWCAGLLRSSTRTNDSHETGLLIWTSPWKRKKTFNH